MENEDKGQTSPRSIDSNMEGEIQPSIETKLELIPVEAEQVSSLTTNHVPMGEPIKTSKELVWEKKKKIAQESVDIEYMNQQLCAKHKVASENWSEKDQLAQASSHPGGISPDDNEVYRKALKCIPMRLLDIEYVRQVEISNVLNRERDDRCDYRLVAGHLDFPATFINTAANSRSPMMAIFENSGRILGKDFVTALFACRRFDVMKLVVEYYFKAHLQHSVSQEERRNLFKDTSVIKTSLEERVTSEERSRASSGPHTTVLEDTMPTTSAGQPIQVSSTPHEEPQSFADDADWADSVKGAKEFWDQIPSERGLDYKKLKNVMRQFKRLFTNDKYMIEFPSTWKLIVHTLKIDPAASGDTLVTPENFRRMLAFFGPPTADEDGCIKMAGKLRKKSQRTYAKSNSSWFAGMMDQNETERVLKNQEAGTFLVRFSASFPDEGTFVLAIKSKASEVVQFHIEQDRSSSGRDFRISGQQLKFSSLWDVVEFYEVNALVDEDGELNDYLERPCPQLPLNAICTGYKKLKIISKGPVHNCP